jgi:hypothetical protein
MDTCSTTIIVIVRTNKRRIRPSLFRLWQYSLEDEEEHNCENRASWNRYDPGDENTAYNAQVDSLDSAGKAYT